MVMETVPQHFITQFSSQYDIIAQQMESRLRKYCKVFHLSGDEWAYDGVGAVEARELTGSNNPTVFSSIDHSRRRIPRREFEVTLPMDAFNVEGRLTDPQGVYAEAIAYAMQRQFDLVVYDAMFADVASGRRFENTTTFASSGLTVTATGGLTMAKLLEIKQNFMDSDVSTGKRGFKIAMGITGDEQTQLLDIAELTSGDYSRDYVLEEGEIVRAMGIDLVPFAALANRPVIPVSGGVRTSFAMSEGAIAVAMSREPKFTVKDRPDLVEVTQIQATMAMGACRTRENKIQKVTFTDN